MKIAKPLNNRTALTLRARADQGNTPKSKKYI